LRWWRNIRPGEGWTVLLLHVVVVLAAAWTVALTPGAPPRPDLLLLAGAGFAFGYLLSRLRAPDLAAHLLALTTGLAASAWLTSDRMAAGGDRIADPALFSVILGLTVFLVAHTSAWTLYRRGWLAAALFLPGAIAFVDLGLARTANTLPLVILIAAGCMMASRYHVFRRSQAWARAGLAAPGRLPQRFLWAGAGLALIAAILGWTMPISAREGLGQAWSRVEEPWSHVQQRWDDLLARMAGVSNLSGGSYASFGDEFRLGGALNLSDEPVMIYRPVSAAAGPTYLAGHRYDNYNGHGWSTRVEDTFTSVNDEGQRFSAQMTFARGQGVHLSPEVTGDRAEVIGAIEPIRPKGDLLFTRDTFLSAGMQVNVQLSWRQLLDAPFDLGGGLSTVPLDLRQIAATLQNARFAPAPASSPGTPSALDPAAAADIAAQIEQLRSRFLDVSWSVNPDGTAATMFVTGQVPVYDDVEAVFASRRVAEGERYQVAGLASTASVSQLRDAPAAYPDWVSSRYLQLPDTITPRTVDLAAGITAGAANPFDAAFAIQEVLRGHITYNEKISPPPRDRDVVDYVLFDSREGYCEYYASAMAVMLRSQGIPARVVGGYYPAAWDTTEGGYLYREKNAHLWVEVFFPGYGWIPFEP
ncbi:MAG: transglutaminase-like domain-containing protein, partial [Chloroflexota bacterium]